MALCVSNSRIPIFEGWLLSCHIWWSLATKDSMIEVASLTFFVIIVPYAEA